MPSPSEHAANGFSGAGSHNQQSAFASQASTVEQNDDEREMLRHDAQLEQKQTASWERPLTVQESRQNDNASPVDDLPLKDWQELEVRYERDMQAAIQHEQSIIDEIEWVMKACVC